MNKQITLSAFNDELAKVRTKKKEFLAQMDRIIPWGEWKALIQPYYYKGERGNKPYELESIPCEHTLAMFFQQLDDEIENTFFHNVTSLASRAREVNP